MTCFDFGEQGFVFEFQIIRPLHDKPSFHHGFVV